MKFYILPMLLALSAAILLVKNVVKFIQGEPLNAAIVAMGFIFFSCAVTSFVCARAMARKAAAVKMAQGVVNRAQEAEKGLPRSQ